MLFPVGLSYCWKKSCDHQLRLVFEILLFLRVSAPSQAGLGFKYHQQYHSKQINKNNTYNKSKTKEKQNITVYSKQKQQLTSNCCSSSPFFIKNTNTPRPNWVSVGSRLFGSPHPQIHRSWFPPRNVPNPWT